MRIFIRTYKPLLLGHEALYLGDIEWPTVTLVQTNVPKDDMRTGTTELVTEKTVVAEFYGRRFVVPPARSGEPVPSICLPWAVAEKLIEDKHVHTEDLKK